MNYYSHHIGDFRSGTFNMDRRERWIYRDMLEVYYDKERPFPSDAALICTMVGARSDEDRAIVADLLVNKFTLSGAGYSNERCDAEIAAYHLKAVAAKENGKKGGRPSKYNPEKPSGFPVGSDQVSGINPYITGSKANQEPITNNQKPITKNQEPSPLQTTPLQAALAPEKKEPKPKSESITASTWDAYSNAYFNRYGTEPVRNAKVNAGIAQFVQRLGKDEAPHVARFFVGHGNGYYVREMHAVGPMLKDAEKLRTEWATNSRMTAHKAMQSDRTQTNFDSFGPLIAAAQSREELEKQQEGNHGE